MAVELRSVSNLTLADLHDIERDPIYIPDSGLSEMQGDCMVSGSQPVAEAAPQPRPTAPSSVAREPAPVTPIGASIGDAANRYLRDVEHALMSGKYWRRPDERAQTLIAEMTQGETGGLETLRQSNVAVLERMEAITPPAGCEDHHRQTVTRSIEMLSPWEGMLSTGDLAGLASITAEAESLKTQAAEVEALTDAIKQAYRL
ncbi:MAG: hypothetical protein ACI8RZ_003431 [Myxococcota bacterium]|jgi:hypothetical protein